MTAAIPQDPLLLLVAYTDGELAAETSAAIEARLAASADLRTQLEEVRALQAGLRTQVPAAPQVLDYEHRRAVLMAAKPLRIRRWVSIRWMAAACLALGMLGLLVSLPAVNMVREGARNSRVIEQLDQAQASAEADEAPTRVAPISSLEGMATPVPSAAAEPGFFALGAGGIAYPSSSESGGRGMSAGDAAGVGGGSDRRIGSNNNQAHAADGEQGEIDGVAINDLKAGNAKESEWALDQDDSRRDGKPDAGAARISEEVAKPVAEKKVATQSAAAGDAPVAAPQAPPPPSITPAARQQEPAVSGPTGQFVRGEDAEKLLAKDKAVWKAVVVTPSAGKPAAPKEKRELQAKVQLDVQEPSETQQRPVFQRIALEDAPVDGQTMLLQARSAGQQLRILPDCLELTPERRPLDPTATFGLATADFQKAFHTVPMTAIADSATLTFAFTADTASFERAMSQLRAGRQVDPTAIRAEHFVNAVPANYPPASGPEAFTLYAEAGPSPFAAGNLTSRTALVSVGAVARPAGVGERRPLALTLAIDCSGSMAQPGGLDRVRAGLSELLERLGDDDSVAVVAFDDRARVVLPATPGAERARIAAAVAGLQASGSTNAGEGLNLAYQLAAESAKPGRESRVLLATDGATLAGEGAAPVLARIAADRARGITLLVVGCGGQQYQGNALDALAAQGDGQHVYVGSDDEARVLFRDKLVPAKLGVLARDAKVQVTWNPQRVTHARLIGFETRRLSARDFRDDRVDAGELAQDSQATALFEVVLVDGGSGPLGTAAVRYLDTRLGTVRELACPLPGSLVRSHLSDRLRVMACSADLAELLGRTWWANQRCATYAGLLAELARCPPSSFREVLRTMTEQAQRLTGEP